MTTPKEFFAKRPWVGFVLIGLACVGLAWLALAPSTGTPSAAETTTAVPTVDVPRPSSTPSATSSATPEPAPDKPDEHEDDHDGEIPVTEAPRPDPTRQPKDSDEKEAVEVIERVVPVWANADLSTNTSTGAWSRTWGSLEGASTAFRGYSQQQFNTLFGGAMQMGASLTDAHVVDRKRLWNNGDQSLWRVTVERKVVANVDDSVLNPAEQVTWDFLVDQTGPSFALVTFSDPNDTALDPKTYQPPGG